jgi:hypothetical protein
MTLKLKIFLGILFSLFYIPGYLLLFKEIGNKDYSLSEIVTGSFFTLFGIFAHSVLIFEKQFQKFEDNHRQVNYVKYFFKALGTSLLLPFGVFLIYVMLFQESDTIKEQDLDYFQGTLSQKPKFEQGSKSSTYLNIYLKEFPEFRFQPIYDEYLHYNTSIENSCEVGDTLIIGIQKDDFDKDIVKTKMKSSSEKHINQDLVMVYYIEKNGDVFYNPSIHNQLDKKDKKLGKYLWIMGVFPLLGCISIWLRELIIILRNNGFNRIADRLEKLREKKII